jgi:hypothetical protein
MAEKPVSLNPINLQDPVGKVVGKRRHAADPLNTSVDSKQRARTWRKAFPTPFVPKGVYRFRSFEEADQWMWKAITRPRKN